MSGRKLTAALTIALAAVGLGACQSSLGSHGGSPEGVPIAIESIDGAPPPVRTALIDELNTAASSRKVELVGSSTEAPYRVRGYLSTDTSEGKTRITYVWDVFDSEKRRARRLTGSSVLGSASGSVSDLDKETLARLASASMDEIAGFLAAAKAEAPIRIADASLADADTAAP
jgi:hypothetical protein